MHNFGALDITICTSIYINSRSLTKGSLIWDFLALKTPDSEDLYVEVT